MWSWSQRDNLRVVENICVQFDSTLQEESFDVSLDFYTTFGWTDIDVSKFSVSRVVEIEKQGGETNLYLEKFWQSEKLSAEENEARLKSFKRKTFSSLVRAGQMLLRIFRSIEWPINVKVGQNFLPELRKISAEGHV